MNPQKINEFKELVKNKRYDMAIKMVPHILDYDQFIAFCKRTGTYCMDIGQELEAHKIELAMFQTIQTKQKEQNLIEAEALAEQAREEAGLARTIYEDSQASFEIMTEKIAHIFDKEIIDYAVDILEGT